MQFAQGGRLTGRPAFVCALALLGTLAAAPAATAPRRVVLVTVDGLSDAALHDEVGVPALRELARQGHAGTIGPGRILPYPAAYEWLTSGALDESLRSRERGPAIGIRGRTLANRLAARGVRTLALPADPFTHAGTGLEGGFTRWLTASAALPESARVDSALAWLQLPGPRFVWLALRAGAAPEAWRRVDGVGGHDAAGRQVDAAAVDAWLGRLLRGLGGDALVLVAGGASAVGADAGAPFVLAGAGGVGRPGAELRFASRAEASAALAQVAAGGRLPPARPRRERARASAPPGLADRERARALGASSRPDSVALLALQALAAETAGDRDVVLELAAGLSRAGREVEAARTYEEWLGGEPGDDAARLAYADHLLRYRRFDVLEDVMAPVHPTSPAAAAAGWRVALARAGRGDHAGALDAAERAARLAIYTPAQLALAPAYRELIRLGERVRGEPRAEAHRYAFAEALGALGLVDAASEQLQVAQTLVPASPEPDHRLGLILLAQGRPQHAAPTLRRALERDSTYLPSRLALADALIELGDRTGARAALEAAARQRTLEARDQYNLACLRATDGDRAGAWAALTGAVEAGYGGADAMLRDPDLDSLRDDPRFAELVARARSAHRR